MPKRAAKNPNSPSGANKKNTRKIQVAVVQPNKSSHLKSQHASPKVMKSNQELMDKALAYLLACMWLNPSKFATGGLSDGPDISSIPNPASDLCVRKPLYAHTDLPINVHQPEDVTVPPYGRYAEVKGQLKDSIYFTTTDPDQTSMNSADNVYIGGKYAAYGSSGASPTLLIPDLRAGLILPVTVKVNSKDAFSLPSVNMNNGTPITPLRAICTSGAGTATQWAVECFLDRGSPTAYALQLRFVNQNGQTRANVDIPVAVNETVVRANINTSVVSTASDIIGVQLYVLTSPVGDVQLLRLQAVKTTATAASASFTFAPIGADTVAHTTAVPTFFEAPDYSCCWWKIQDSPAWEDIVKNGWEDIPAVVEAAETVVSDRTAAMFLGGSQKHGLLDTPVNFNAPYKLITNVTFKSETDLTKGSGHHLCPNRKQLQYGEECKFFEKSNLVMPFSCPRSDSNTYQAFLVSLVQIYSLRTFNQALSGQVNFPNTAAYEGACRMVGKKCLVATYNDDHLKDIKDLTRRARKFYNKHEAVIKEGLGIGSGVLQFAMKMIPGLFL